MPKATLTEKFPELSLASLNNSAIIFENNGVNEFILSYPNSIMPFIFEQQLKKFPNDIDQFKYYSFKTMKGKAIAIFDYIIKHISSDVSDKRFTCTNCQRRTYYKEYSLFNDKPVCKNCRRLLTRDRFYRRLPEKGRLQITYIDGERYIICHKCRYVY